MVHDGVTSIPIVTLTCNTRYGTYSTSRAINAGLDLEMPGPTRWRGQLLTHALMSNKITQHTVDERVREVLKLVRHATNTGIPEHAPEKSRDVPETADLLRRIAGESIVLLKNEKNVLPLNRAKTVSNRWL
jgi:beta-glucosidase